MSIYEIFGTIVQEIDLQDKQHASLASTSGTFIAPIQAAESAGQDDECGELDFAQLTQLLDQALAAGRNRSLVLSILNVLEKSLAALSSSQEALQAHNTGIRMPRDLMNKDGMYLEAWRVVDEARQYSWLYGTKTAGATATAVVAGWRALDALVSAVCKCHELMGEPYLGVARILHNLLVHAAHEMHSVAVVCALQTVKQIAVQEGSAGAAAQRALAEVVAKMCAMASGNADAQDRVCLVYCLLHGWAVAQSAPAKRRDAGILRKSSNGVLASTVTSRSIVAGQVLALDLLDLLLRNINDSTRVYPPFCMLHCSAMPGIARQCGTSTEPQVFDKALALLIALLQRPWDPLKDTLGALFKEVYLAPLQSAWAHSKMCEMANSQSHQVVAMQMAASVQQMLVMRGLMRVCGDARSLVGLLPKSRDAADSSCAFQELFNVLCRIVRVVFEAPPSTPAVTGRLHGVWSSLRGSSEVSATQSGEAEQRKIQHLRMAVMALKCLVAMVDGLGVRYNEAGIYRHTDDISISMHSLRIPESVEDAVSLFNSNPEAGLQTILQLGFIPSDCPDTVMQHLIAGVSGDTSVGKLAACKTRVSRTAMCQLAFSDESCEYLAQAFEQMQLQTQALASALSALFSVFLPDSVQQLDTLLLAFARQFCQRNCAYLNTPSEDGAEAPQDSPPKKEDMSARQVGRVYILACLAVIADYEVWQRQAKIGPDDLLKQYMPMAAKDTTTRAAFCEAFVEIQASPIVQGITAAASAHPGWILSPERPVHPIDGLNQAMFTAIWPALHSLLVRAFERTNVRLWDQSGDISGMLTTESRLQKSLLQQVLDAMQQCLRIAGQSKDEAIIQQAVGGLERMAGLDRTVVEWKHGEAARAIMQVAVEERAALAPVWDQLAQLLASVGARLESHIVFDGEKPAGSPDSDKTLFSPIGDSSSFSSADGSKSAVHALEPPTYVEMVSMESEPVGMPLTRLLGYMDALARVASIEAQQQCMGSEAGSIKSGGSEVRVQKSHGSISTVGSCRSADSVERATRNVRKMFNILEALASDRSAFEWLAVWDHISQYIAGLGCPGRTSSNARALAISLAFGLVGHLARSPKFSVLQLQDRVLKVLVRIAKATRDLAVIQYIASELNTLVAKCLVCLGSGWTAVFDMVSRMARHCTRSPAGPQVRDIAISLLHTVEQSLDAPPSVKFGRLPALRALVAVAVCAQPGSSEDGGLAESVMGAWVRLSGKMIDQISGASLSLSIATIWDDGGDNEGEHCELPPEVQSIITALVHLLTYEPAAILRNVQSPPQAIPTLGDPEVAVPEEASSSSSDGQQDGASQGKSDPSLQLSSNNGTCGSSQSPPGMRASEFEDLRTKLIDVAFASIQRALPLLGRHAYKTLLHGGFLRLNAMLLAATPACMACWSYVLGKWLDLLMDCLKSAHMSLSVRQDSFRAFLDLAGAYTMAPLEPLTAEALRSISTAVNRYASECQAVPDWVWAAVIAKLRQLIGDTSADMAAIGRGLAVAAEREAARQCGLHARILKLVYLLSEEHPDSGQAWAWLAMLEDSHIHASTMVRHGHVRRLVKQGDLALLAPAYMRLELVAHAARISVAFRVMRIHVAGIGVQQAVSSDGCGHERLSQLVDDLVGMSADIVESYFLTQPAAGTPTDIGLISIAHTVAATLELWADVYVLGSQGQKDSAIGMQLAGSVDALVLKVCDVLEVTEQPFVRKAAAKFMRSALCYLST